MFAPNAGAEKARNMDRREPMTKITLPEAIIYLHELVDAAPDRPNKYAVSAQIPWRTILAIRILLARHEEKPATAAAWSAAKAQWESLFKKTDVLPKWIDVDIEGDH